MGIGAHLGFFHRILEISSGGGCDGRPGLGDFKTGIVGSGAESGGAEEQQVPRLPSRSLRRRSE
jgi:hypothetical protein